MDHKIINGWVLLSLLMSTLVYAYPPPQSAPNHIAAQYVPQNAQHQAEYQHHQYLRQQQPQPRIQHYQVHSPEQLQHQQQQQFQQQQPEFRKFAEKPNALKKVSLDDIDQDIQTNQIDGNLFSWTNMLSSVMQMVFNANNAAAPTKSDDLDSGSNPASPWTNAIAIALKVITTLLGGGGGVNDGIDKVDNGNSSPMQNILAAVLTGVLGTRDQDQVNMMAKQAGEFINIVVNLLDALKTSFSHRALAARSSGKSDSMSDLGIASITMLKGFVKTTGSESEKCMQKYMCEANTECNNDIGGNSIMCQMGNYATSYVLERTTGNAFEKFFEAGRKGRNGDNCSQIYLECNDQNQ